MAACNSAYHFRDMNEMSCENLKWLATKCCDAEMKLAEFTLERRLPFVGVFQAKHESINPITLKDR